MDNSKLNEMNRQFHERLSELMSRKGRNIRFFTNESYTKMIEQVKSAKSKTSHKKPEDYQRLRRFDVMAVGGIDKLIAPVKNNMIRYYVKNNEIFQILHDTHLRIRHGGRTRMEKELNFQYKNITREMITIYLNLCERCEEKRSVPKKGLVVKPILSGEMKARCHVSLLRPGDADDQFEFILVYQDHLTKFVQLRPLKTETAKEIAFVLSDIFTIYGAPNILHCSKGREFANKVVQEACAMWPELKIVHGESIHSQSDESVHKDNLIMWEVLETCLKDNNIKNWSEGLRFVQLARNRSHHKGINCTPYEAMFGTKLKIGFKSLEEELVKIEKFFEEDDEVESDENYEVESDENYEVESDENYEVESDENDEEEFLDNYMDALENYELKLDKNNDVEFNDNYLVEPAEYDQLEPIETDRVKSTQNDMNLFSASSSQISLPCTVDEKSEKTSDTDLNPIPTNKNENLERKNENVMAVRKRKANEMVDVSSPKYLMAANGDTEKVASHGLRYYKSRRAEPICTSEHASTGAVSGGGQWTRAPPAPPPSVVVGTGPVSLSNVSGQSTRGRRATTQRHSPASQAMQMPHGGLSAAAVQALANGWSLPGALTQAQTQPVLRLAQAQVAQAHVAARYNNAAIAAAAAGMPQHRSQHQRNVQFPNSAITMAMGQQPPPPLVRSSANTSTMNVPPQVTGTMNGHSTSHSVDSRKRLTPIPDINITGNHTPYKVQKALVENTMVPCINAKPYQYTELLMTLPDLASHFFPRVSLTTCRAMLDALGITLYRPNSTQLQVLRNSGKCKSAAAGENGLALVQIRDVMQHMPQFKYMLRSGLAGDEAHAQPRPAHAHVPPVKRTRAN